LVKRERLQRILLFVLLFGSMLILGLVENIKAVSFPLIRDEFAVPFRRQGLMVSLLSCAYFVFNIVAGIWIGRSGARPPSIAGYAVICLGLLLVPVMPGFFWIGVALFIIFSGFGFLDIGMNALASRVFVTKAALLMNLLHSSYGIGSMAGPFLAGLLVGGSGFDWRHAYLFSLPPVLLLFALMFFVRFSESGRLSQAGELQPAAPATDSDVPATKARSGKSFLDALRMPLVWLLATALGLGIVLEATSSNWGPLYFRDIHGLDPATDGAAFLSTFFLLFTVSRLLCGPFLERLGYVRSLIAISFLIIAVYLVGFALGARGILVLPALGFFVALYWPTLMAVAIVSFGRDAPVCIGAMIAIAGLINAVMQFVVGLVNSALGPAWGYRSSLVYAVLMILVLTILYRKLRGKFRLL